MKGTKYIRRKKTPDEKLKINKYRRQQRINKKLFLKKISLLIQAAHIVNNQWLL